MKFRFFRERLHLPSVRLFLGFSCRASLFLQITRLCVVSQFLPLHLLAEDDVTRRLSPTFLFPRFLHLEEYLLVHPGFLLPASRRFPPPRPPAGDDAARRLSPRPLAEFRPPSALPQAAAQRTSPARPIPSAFRAESAASSTRPTASQPQQHQRQPDAPLLKKSAAKPVRLGQCHAKECPRRRFPESANRFCWHIPHKPRARQTPQRRTQRTHRLSRRNSRQCRPRRKAAQRRAHAEQHSASQRPRVKRQGHNAVDIHHRQPA